MTKRIGLWLPLVALFAVCPAVLAQAKAPAPQAKAPAPKKAAKVTQPPATDAQKKNIQEYIELLRADVRQQKAQIMGAVMQLGASDAAKFWPIYEEFDGELTTLNNHRSEDILEYARAYNQMTDEKADELIKRFLDYQKQRSDLLGKYFERVKQALGAITAARFLQIEHQLLLIIDLQIASSLPIVGQA